MLVIKKKKNGDGLCRIGGTLPHVPVSVKGFVPAHGALRGMKRFAFSGEFLYKLTTQQGGDMNFKDLVIKNRTRRVFDESRPVDAATLAELVDVARYTPSARNLQPLKYVVTADPAQCAEIFPLLGWAGYLKDWKGPAEGERPTGYVVILLDRSLTDDPMGDQGIVSQTIMLAAVEKGLGGCIIGTVNRKKLAELLALPDNLDILLVLALGVPAEEVVVEPLPADGKIEYWRTPDGTHHVPKRGLDEVLVATYPNKS